MPTHASARKPSLLTSLFRYSVLSEPSSALWRRKSKRQRGSLRRTGRTPIAVQPQSRHGRSPAWLGADEHSAASSLPDQERPRSLGFCQRPHHFRLWQRLASAGSRDLGTYQRPVVSAINCIVASLSHRIASSFIITFSVTSADLEKARSYRKKHRYY